MFGLERRVSTQSVDYTTCSCACSHTKRPVSAHFLSYEVISMRNVTKFSIDKSKRCTTARLNLRNLLSMHFFHIQSHVWEQWFDPRERLRCLFTVKRRPLHNFLTYMDVFAWKCSHRSTCLHTTCHTISYVVLDRHVSTQCVHYETYSCACSHTKRSSLYTFWLTKSCLCVTLNISHLLCHIISHKCSRNKVQHRNFLTYEPFSLCNFWLTRTSPCANCHIGRRVCVQLTT